MSKKRHNFKYRDPENAAGKKVRATEKATEKPELPEPAIKDLKRGALTILGFLVLITLIYLFREALNIQGLAKLLKI